MTIYSRVDSQAPFIISEVFQLFPFVFCLLFEQCGKDLINIRTKEKWQLIALFQRIGISVCTCTVKMTTLQILKSHGDGKRNPLWHNSRICLDLQQEDIHKHGVVGRYKYSIMAHYICISLSTRERQGGGGGGQMGCGAVPYRGI